MLVKEVAHAEGKGEAHDLSPADVASASQFQPEVVYQTHRIELKMDVAVDGLQSKGRELQVEIVVKHRTAAAAVVRALLSALLEADSNLIVARPCSGFGPGVVVSI
jgi:hypothetical protein